MLDHIGIDVLDLAAAKTFYAKALAPLGYKLLMEFPEFAGFGVENQEGPLANFWLHQTEHASKPLHFAFRAPDRKTVDAFYEAALAAGAKDNGAPGIRDLYHANYYGAFVLDLEGRNLEVVCHQAE